MASFKCKALDQGEYDIVPSENHATHSGPQHWVEFSLNSLPITFVKQLRFIKNNFHGVTGLRDD
jgi:hypothetical protein